jgi:hypothetical protein
MKQSETRKERLAGLAKDARKDASAASLNTESIFRLEITSERAGLERL